MADLTGQRLGQYEIIELIGQGGMASVYRAKQTSVGRDVAIKVLSAELGNTEEFMKRFEREARIVASLSHPHILKIFDFGQQEKIAYLVMELLTGGSLFTLMRRGKGPLPTEIVMRMADQIAQGLDYAHERSIVHRDLKPPNVLLDQKENAFLTDFGISKVLEETTQLTQGGAILGTPSYMSPEQWRGDPVDHRADIYALGVMLYEMLVGKVPFKGDTAYAIMHGHLNETPPPIRTARPDLPSTVEQIISKALAKTPEERFTSAGQFITAFKNEMARIGPIDVRAEPAIGPGQGGGPAPRTAPSRTRPMPPGAGIPATVRRAAAEPANRTPFILGAAGLGALVVTMILVAILSNRPIDSAAMTQTAAIVAALGTASAAPTAVNTATSTATAAATSTVTRTSTQAATQTATRTASQVATLNSTSININVLPSLTATATRTNTPSATPTNTPTSTLTRTQTATLFVPPTRTFTPTATETAAPTATDTRTPTITPSPSPTADLTTPASGLRAFLDANFASVKDKDRLLSLVCQGQRSVFEALFSRGTPTPTNRTFDFSGVKFEVTTSGDTANVTLSGTIIVTAAGTPQSLPAPALFTKPQVMKNESGWRYCGEK